MPFGAAEFLVLVLVLVLLFGSSRLPQLARSVREAKSEYKSMTPDEPTSPRSTD